MIVRLVAQMVLATSLLQVFPLDAGVVERAATLPQARDMQAESVQVALSLLHAELPQSPDADRAPVKVIPTSIGVVTSAVSAIVVDRISGKVLYEKNSEMPRSIGSITKLMTAYVFLEDNPDLDAKVSIQPEDLRFGGIQHVATGDDVTVRNLLEASLIGSDNSATGALVRLSGKSLGDFVSRMNELAAEMGARKTTFVDSTGLSSENRSIAPDIVSMLNYILENDVIRDATNLPSVNFQGASGRVYSIESTNELLGSFLNNKPYKIVGGKTGFLPEAGYCFGAIISENGGHEIIVVVLGSLTKEGRFQDAKSLAAWAYKVFDWPDQIGI